MLQADHDRNSFPKVIASSVIRSAHQGESHGGVYIVCLQTGSSEQVIDWNDDTINWEGRGGDRGLRGIAFHDNKVYLAASDEIFVYTKDFELIESYRNKYLKHCHEIYICDDMMFLTSTGFDSILEFDLIYKSFTRGYCLRHSILQRSAMYLHHRLLRQWGLFVPKLSTFDPNGKNGPLPGDTVHINSVHHSDGSLYVSGTGIGHLLFIRKNKLFRHAKIPYGTHNARPFKEGILLNNTSANQVAYLDSHGQIIESFPSKSYKEDELLMSDLPQDHARQAFTRGLCVTTDGLIIGGSSPATISVYQCGRPTPIKTVNITMDVRNAIHGLEIWPY